VIACRNIIACCLISWTSLAGASPDIRQETVGRRGTNRTVLPVNQEVTPAGRQLDLPGVRPQVLVLSRDAASLYVAGKSSELIVLDSITGNVRQRVALPSEEVREPNPKVVSPNILEPDKKGQVSFTGLVASPDGRKLYLSNVNGSIKVFAVSADGAVSPSHSLPLPPGGAPRRSEEIPAGLAISPDGKRLYVCGNLSNRLLELDADSGAVLRTFDVGVAPYDVLVLGQKVFVSNWGGRRPEASDLTGPAGRGTVVRVDPIRNIASEGSVSVINLESGRLTSEIITGLHASALASSPDGRWVVCANAASDTLSVLDARKEALVETIWTKPNPSDLFGASPNAIAFDKSGKSLFVANGTQNAIGMVNFHPKNRGSKLTGLIPVGWFPGAIVYDANHQQLCVANIKGHAVEPKPHGAENAPGFNSHQYNGSVSLIPVPKPRELAAMSQTVWFNLRRDRIVEALKPARSGQPARVIPERIGEPSLIKHVVYIIKENRTYDQVLGDIPQGNGDARLCVFGRHVTPNQHRIVEQFALLDNAYCSGILSADGHQWSTTAFATDYMEKSFAGFPRSYPDGMGLDEMDALAYAPSGFIWDNALKHHVSIWNFGEFAMPVVGWKDSSRKGEPVWQDFWAEFQRGDGKVSIGSQPSVESMRPFTPTNYVGWEMSVPDVWRARYITNQLAKWESKGEMPQMVLICLPDDHTSGTSAGSPTPAACVADNDLAFGQILEALSHSRFWKDMAVFGIEDDPQAGWDHVSGYRTTMYLAGPYVRRHAVVGTQYNTTSIIRTMEQILGMHPMNQFDASALPMTDCFTDVADLTSFSAVANEVPLDQMNPARHAIADPTLRRDAQLSDRMDFRHPDRAPEDSLNRILWHSMKGVREPYPEWAITVTGASDDD